MDNYALRPDYAPTFEFKEEPGSYTIGKGLEPTHAGQQRRPPFCTIVIKAEVDMYK
jgi:hypothetical protein